MVMFTLNPHTLAVGEYGDVYFSPSGAAYDPVTGQTYTMNGGSLRYFPSGDFIMQTGTHNVAADWYDPGGFLLAVDVDTWMMRGVYPDGTEIDIGPWPFHVDPAVYTGLGWDPDTKLAWLFYARTGGIATLAIDPADGRVAVIAPNLGGAAAAGGIDDVPEQRPHLYATGTCPGPMYITAVDMTPHGEVGFAQGSTLGTTTPTSGPCAGTSSGLANPRRRATLTASSNGIATHRFDAPAELCDAAYVQAIDMSTCLTTQVELVRHTWTPPRPL
jgi:hypothetical protein